MQFSSVSLLSIGLALYHIKVSFRKTKTFVIFAVVFPEPYTFVWSIVSTYNFAYWVRHNSVLPALGRQVYLCKFEAILLYIVPGWLARAV